MNPEQKAILRKWRVELVENINILDGLFTQLLSREVLTSRTVYRVKLNRPPAEQVEELLDELQKKDCFEQLCEALTADGQEHIVTKFLKQPKKIPEVDSPALVVPAASASSSVQGSGNVAAPFPQETANAQRDGNSSSATLKEQIPNSMIHASEQSPSKRLRLIENDSAVILYEPGETRYLMKHYVTDAADIYEKDVLVEAAAIRNSNPIFMMNNPQSIQNHNISDPVRYMAAFAQQSSARLSSENMIPERDVYHNVCSSSAAPFAESPCKNSKNSISFNGDVRSLLRPSNSPQRFVSLSHGMSTKNLTVSQHSNQTNVPSPSKAYGLTLSSSPPVRDPGFVDQIELSRSDSVDTMLFKDSVKESARGRTESSSGRPFVDNDLQDTKAAYRSKHSEAFPDQKQLLTLGGWNALTEMDDIDLPDGCVQVRVEHCTEEFFHSNYKKSYPMHQLPRGYALIINVNQVTGKPARTGTNFDRDNLCNLLAQLHFNIIVYDDVDGLSAKEMVMKLKTFSKMEQHLQADACFICLLSHGEEEYIFGTDGKRIPLNEIFMLFDNSNCKGLIGKPKVFIIQACRGGSLDKGVVLDEPDGGSAPTRANSQLPSMSDMLICFPTLTGYYAWRNRARGSWYIEAIVQIFMRYAKNEDVCAMLNRVNHLVSRKVSESYLQEMNQMSQMSEYKSTLRFPHFYLFPGIAIKLPPQHQVGPMLARRQ